VPAVYRIPAVAVPRFLDDAVRDVPERPAVVAGRDAIDHATLARRVGEVAAVLVAHGVGAGDRVVVALANDVALPVVLLASWRVGAVVVPVPADTDEAWLHAVVTDVRPAIVIGGQRPLRLLDGAELTGSPPALLVTGDEWPRPGRLPRPPRLRRPHRRHGAVPMALLADALAGVEPGPPPNPPRPSDPALISYRGSDQTDADAPIGVVSSHANLVAAVFQARLWVPDVQAGRERMLLTEACHDPTLMTAGLLMGLLSAACLVLADDPDPADLARIVARQAPTLVVAPAEHLASLRAAGQGRRREVASLRACLISGPSVEPELAAAVEHITDGARVRAVYGPPEVGACTHAQPVYGRVVPDSLGLPVTGTVAAVVDPDDVGSMLAPGEIGRLIVHGPQVPGGTWGRREDDRRTYRHGWSVTDDLAVVDGHGVFTRVGRVAPPEPRRRS